VLSVPPRLRLTVLKGCNITDSSLLSSCVGNSICAMCLLLEIMVFYVSTRPPLGSRWL